MNKAIEQLRARLEVARSESDFTYFFTLLLLGELVTKLVTLSFIAAVSDNKERSRYRLEHRLVRADGIGEWVKVLEESVSGSTADYLLVEAQNEQSQIARNCKKGDWQYDSVVLLKEAVEVLGIDTEEVPQKSDLKRWFRIFAALRNKTRGHGATTTNKLSELIPPLAASIDLIIENFTLVARPTAHLYRSLSGKYRVSMIAGSSEQYDHLKSQTSHSYPNGVYIHFGSPRKIGFIETSPELNDFFVLNGGFNGKKYELLSYVTDNRSDGDASLFNLPPEGLPNSETEGFRELQVRDECFTNAPDPIPDYVPREKLQNELFRLLQDDRRSIITLVGRGGIGKTSLTLRVLQEMYKQKTFDVVVWFSSRDVDLQFQGPKAVKQRVFSQRDVADFYASLMLPVEKTETKGFSSLDYFQGEMTSCEAGPTLFIFDNFETTQNPLEMYTWIDTYIRPPNKALITTRLREFRGDYPMEVFGMEERESLALIEQTARYLRVESLLSKENRQEIISVSDGHPYVIKILLGNVATLGRVTRIERIVASSDEILSALFERTYASLSPCAQRTLMTLSSWNSAVPRVALEAVLLASISETQEVERGIEALLKYSIAEVFNSTVDGQEFIGLPLVASIFGKKKLSISPLKDAIQTDIETLQMLGPSQKRDVHLGVAQRLANFVSSMSRTLDSGESVEKYSPMLEMICRSYSPGWLILARWHMERGTDPSLLEAEAALKHFLESDPSEAHQLEAWYMLSSVHRSKGDRLSELHCYVERTQVRAVSYSDISNTANFFNRLVHTDPSVLSKDLRRAFAEKILRVMSRRSAEARADDFSRMGWLAIHLEQKAQAREYAESGLKLDPDNMYCLGIYDRTL